MYFNKEYFWKAERLVNFSQKGLFEVLNKIISKIQDLLGSLPLNNVQPVMQVVSYRGINFAYSEVQITKRLKPRLLIITERQGSSETSTTISFSR